MNLQIVLSFLGITLFPFIVRNAIENLYSFTKDEYEQILKERKSFIAGLLAGFYPKLNNY